MLSKPLLPSLLLLCISLPAAAAPAPLVDLLPLKKALAPLGGAGPLRSSSTISMTGTQAGVSVTLREDLQIVSRLPGRFHAIVTQHGSAGIPSKKLIVISNGTQVWTYRPNTGEYSVTSRAAFEKNDSDVPTLGLVIGGFFLGEGRSLASGMRGITPENSAEVLEALHGMDIAITRQTESVGGADDYIYSLALAKQGLAYKFSVNTQNGALSRLELTGTQDGVKFTYREDRLLVTSSPAVSASTFTFAPPLGTVKVPAIPITPY